MRVSRSASVLVVLVGLHGCGGQNTPSEVAPPGVEPTAKSRVLETGAMLMQDRTPVDQIHLYVCAWHFYSGELDRQVEAHHYCIQTNEELHQCIIFDGNGKDARLIGIEYIISARLFATLPEEERQLWHSHDYEIKSGQLIAPGLPEAAEHAAMEKLVSTYGKTIHTWQVDRKDPLPMGTPRIMMAFTADGQIREELVAERDRRFGISTAERRRNREDIPAPTPIPGANSWETGVVPRLELTVEDAKAEP